MNQEQKDICESKGGKRKQQQKLRSGEFLMLQPSAEEDETWEPTHVTEHETDVSVTATDLQKGT
jgi:hypothetical protein